MGAEREPGETDGDERERTGERDRDPPAGAPGEDDERGDEDAELVAWPLGKLEP